MCAALGVSGLISYASENRTSKENNKLAKTKLEQRALREPHVHAQVKQTERCIGHRSRGGPLGLPLGAASASICSQAEGEPTQDPGGFRAY